MPMIEQSSLPVQMFGTGLTPEQYGSKLEAFKSAMLATHAETYAGKTAWVPPEPGNVSGGVLRKGVAADPKAALARLDVLEKGVSGDAGMAAELAAFRADYVASLQKDWTPTNPVPGTGLTAYDLEAPAKILVPLHTPLRNSIPREKGVGNARKFKRIDSFSNAGIPGGAGTILPFFNSLTQTSTWGPTGNLTLARPQKIQYTGSDWTYAYVELGLSDSVDWVAYFESLGFEDLRALSHTALLYSHLMGEERAILYARGATGNGYSGLVAAPTIGTVTTATTGGTIPATTYYVYLTTNTGAGESLPTTVQSIATTGTTSTITVPITTMPSGSLGNVNVYLGTTTGITNAKYQGAYIASTGGSVVLTAYNAAGTAATGVDTSFNANGYDGYLTIQSNPALTGYYRNLGTALSATNPMGEFDLAFSTMYQNNGADPDEIWVTGATRNQINQNTRSGSNNGAQNGYRTELHTGPDGQIIGTMVTGTQNGNTGKVVGIKTHRFMLPGCALFRSLSLPIENSRVTAPVSMVNVQDYMAVDWPDIQMTKDTSTYQIGTMIHRAPGWSGLITGIVGG